MLAILSREGINHEVFVVQDLSLVVDILLTKLLVVGMRRIVLWLSKARHLRSVYGCLIGYGGQDGQCG